MSEINQPPTEEQSNINDNQNKTPINLVFKKVSFSHGLKWLIEGFHLVKQNPGAWFASILITIVISFLIGQFSLTVKVDLWY